MTDGGYFRINNERKTSTFLDLPVFNGYYFLLMNTHSDTCTDHLQGYVLSGSEGYHESRNR